MIAADRHQTAPTVARRRCQRVDLCRRQRVDVDIDQHRRRVAGELVGARKIGGTDDGDVQPSGSQRRSQRRRVAGRALDDEHLRRAFDDGGTEGDVVLADAVTRFGDLDLVAVRTRLVRHCLERDDLLLTGDERDVLLVDDGAVARQRHRRRTILRRHDRRSDRVLLALADRARQVDARHGGVGAASATDEVDVDRDARSLEPIDLGQRVAISRTAVGDEDDAALGIAR